GSQNTEAVLTAALTDPSPEVRLYAVRWIADDRLTSLRDQVAKLLDGAQGDSRYFLAVLAAISWLGGEGNQPSTGITDRLLVQELEQKDRPPALTATLLSLLNPDNKFLASEQLATYLHGDAPQIRLEAARALAQQTRLDRFAELAEVAKDSGQSDAVRAEAIMGLAGAAQDYQQLLSTFAVDNQHSALQAEARRVQRLARLTPQDTEKKP